MLDFVLKTTFWGASLEDKTWALKDLTATKPPSEKQLWYHRSQSHSSLFKWTKTTSAVWFHYHGVLLCCLPRHLCNSVELILVRDCTYQLERGISDTNWVALPHLVFTLLLVKQALNSHAAAASCGFMQMALNCTHLQKPDLQVQDAKSGSALPTFFLNVCY